jgi:putative Mn2+ efflux pump MntP
MKHEGIASNTPARSRVLRAAGAIFVYIAICALIGLALAAMEHNLTFENILGRIIFVLVLPVRWEE